MNGMDEWGERRGISWAASGARKDLKMGTFCRKTNASPKRLFNIFGDATSEMSNFKLYKQMTDVSKHLENHSEPE
jgi:hypothetical protein